MSKSLKIMNTGIINNMEDSQISLSQTGSIIMVQAWSKTTTKHRTSSRYSSKSCLSMAKASLIIIIKIKIIQCMTIISTRILSLDTSLTKNFLMDNNHNLTTKY